MVPITHSSFSIKGPPKGPRLPTPDVPMITTSQVALALDVLAHMPIFEPKDVHLSGSVAPLKEEDPREALIRKAAAVINLAFTPGWTGKMDGQCAEYGKSPVMEDPEAQSAVLKLKAISGRVALEASISGHNEPMANLIADIQNIIDP